MSSSPLRPSNRRTRIALYACAGAHLVGATALPGNLEQDQHAADYEQATGQKVWLQATPVGGGLALELVTWLAAALLFLLAPEAPQAG